MELQNLGCAVLQMSDELQPHAAPVINPTGPDG